MGDKIPLVLSPPSTPLLGVVSNFPRRFLVLNRWLGTCYLQKQDNFFAQPNIKNSPFPIFYETGLCIKPLHTKKSPNIFFFYSPCWGR